jgi:predicted transcriptional regulator
MTNGLTGSQPEWLALWRSAMSAQDLTHREVDDLAGLAEGYVSKLMCGQVREPTAATISKMNRALRIRLHAEHWSLTP